MWTKTQVGGLVYPDNTDYASCMTSPNLAKLLRDLRSTRGESLREAAGGLCIDPSHLSRLERGEKQPSSELRQRAAHYYEVDDELLSLASGDVPTDIVEILRSNPQLIDELRNDYGEQSAS